MLITKLLLLFIGGGLGTLCRYGISLLTIKNNAHFTLGTFLSNVISSLVIGYLTAYFLRNDNEMLRLLLITGYCGGFSTFSTFSAENYSMITEGKWFELGVYIIASISVCVFSVLIGIKLGMK